MGVAQLDHQGVGIVDNVKKIRKFGRRKVKIIRKTCVAGGFDFVHTGLPKRDAWRYRGYMACLFAGLMIAVIANGTVVEVDGEIKSHNHIFAEALVEGQLRGMFICAIDGVVRVFPIKSHMKGVGVGGKGSEGVKFRFVPSLEAVQSVEFALSVIICLIITVPELNLQFGKAAKTPVIVD